MGRKAILYARVSSDEQAEHGYSLPTQLDAMRKYAADNSLAVVAEFVDDCSGTIRLYDRPQGKNLLGVLERKEADALVFHTFDRLSRNLGHAVVMREEWQRAGVEIHTVTRGKSENTAEARLLDNVEAVIAEFEREKIIERSRRGRRAKAAAGKWVGAGSTPFGYRREGLKRNVSLLIADHEAEIVRRIFKLYIGSDSNRPQSFLAIAKLLTGEGIKPPGGPIGPGRGWYESTVKRIVSRPAYVGAFHYADNTIKLPELALIDRKTWELAQARRSKNKDGASRNRKHEYLLSGKFKCHCGTMMLGTLAHRKLNLAYYRCGRQTHYHHLPKCKETSHVRTDIADSLVWNWLADLMSDDEKMRHGMQRRRELSTEDLRPKQNRLDLLEELITGIDRKIQKLLSAFAGEQDDTLSAVLKAEISSLTKQRAALANERDSLTVQFEDLSLTPAQEEELLTGIAKLRSGIRDADFVTKRYFLDRLNVEVKLRRDEAGMRWLDVTCSVMVTTESLPIDLLPCCNMPARRQYSACASRPG